jgi:hypothetical protein
MYITVAMDAASTAWTANSSGEMNRKVFGSVGIALALYFTAAPENRVKVAGLLIPATLTAIAMDAASTAWTANSSGEMNRKVNSSGSVIPTSIAVPGGRLCPAR